MQPRRPARLAWLALAIAGALACESGETCPEGQARRPAIASASEWAPVRAPDDLALTQAPARVILAGDRQAVIRPLFRAQIVRFHVVAGDRVVAGQPVVDVIMPEVLAAAADYRGATRRREVQRGRRDKLQRLREEGLVAEGAIFEVASRTSETEAQAIAAAAVLRAAGVEPAAAWERLQHPAITLESPIEGVVREVSGRLGEVLEGPGAPIAVIVGEGAPRIEARFLHPPVAAAMRFVAVDGSTWPLRSPAISTVIEADDGAAVMWFEPADPIQAPPGLRGVVEATALDPTLVEVPAAAILSEGEGARIVFRRRGDEVVAVAVEVEAASGSSALVRAREPGALEVGDRIAVDARAHARARAAEAEASAEEAGA
ncbi:MAG: efflux RND transporter periplasmic adaptor subunit [Nannocystaceae bacterium]